MSLQWAAARLHTHRCVRGRFTVGRSLDNTCAMLPGLLSPQPDSLCCETALTLQPSEGASSPFLLKNDMTGFTLWTFPQLTDTVPWVRGSLHSNASVLYTPDGKTGYYRSPGECCQITIFAKSKPSTAAILSINVLLPGWCGSSIVGNDVLPVLARRGRCFNARET